MEQSQKMVEELTEKRKMTKIVKDILHKRILVNCLIALCVTIYLAIIDIMHIYIDTQTISIVYKVLAMLTIISTVIIFEVAYRKDSGRFAIFGIEFFILSIFVLYIPKIYGSLDKKFSKELLIIPLLFIVYYFIKVIVIHLKTQKDYQNNLSDVKEIMKDED